MQDHLQYIDEYFEGALSAEETSQFERRITEDKEFAREVAFYLSAKQTLKEEINAEKKKWFRQLADQNNSFSKTRQIVPVRKTWIYMAAAAVIICVFFAGYMLFVKPSSPRSIAERFIQERFQPLPVPMAVDTSNIQKGLRLYNDGKLTASLEVFEKITKADTANFEAKNYAAIVYLRLENYDKALAYFQDLEKYTSRYSNPAKLYHALTLMKRNQPGDKQIARRLLMQVRDNGLEGKETAKQWLKKL
jgi:tetratricopeptide (TPR) repeat protein